MNGPSTKKLRDACVQEINNRTAGISASDVQRKFAEKVSLDVIQTQPFVFLNAEKVFNSIIGFIRSSMKEDVLLPLQFDFCVETKKSVCNQALNSSLENILQFHLPRSCFFINVIFENDIYYFAEHDVAIRHFLITTKTKKWKNSFTKYIDTYSHWKPL